MAIDPIAIDEEGLQQSIDTATEFLNELSTQQEAGKRIEQETQTETAKATAEQDDPRNKENWGFKGLV